MSSERSGELVGPPSTNLAASRPQHGAVFLGAEAGLTGSPALVDHSRQPEPGLAQLCFHTEKPVHDQGTYLSAFHPCAMILLRCFVGYRRIPVTRRIWYHQVEIQDDAGWMGTVETISEPKYGDCKTGSSVDKRRKKGRGGSFVTMGVVTHWAAPSHPSHRGRG